MLEWVMMEGGDVGEKEGGGKKGGWRGREVKRRVGGENEGVERGGWRVMRGWREEGGGERGVSILVF